MQKETANKTMSSLAEQLKSAKLKKSVVPMKDYSCPKKAGFLKEDDIKEYERSVLEVNTENWLDILRDLTFPTILCPLYIEEAFMFINIYERLYANKEPEIICNTDWKFTLSVEENACVDNLLQRLQTSMDPFTNKGYAFVKTSSRSAKDAPLVQNKFRELYRNELDLYTSSDKCMENVQITCLLKAAFIALRVKTAAEVVDMFMRSERIYQDMLLAAVNQREKYNEHFVIRQFVNIDVDMEFRGFVWDFELVALSQYNYAIYSERLAKDKDKYGHMVKTYFHEFVKPTLQSSMFPKNSIVDFAICDDGDKLWVIEVNPFLETTDGALFSWQHERHILEGSDGFVFRVTEKPRPGAKTILPQSIRGLMEEK